VLALLRLAHLPCQSLPRMHGLEVVEALANKPVHIQQSITTRVRGRHIHQSITTRVRGMHILGGCCARCR
jgi:hypothetical protein